MSETVYIETSILGYLTARPTDNLILAANIKITQDWWDEYSSLFFIPQKLLKMKHREEIEQLRIED